MLRLLLGAAFMLALGSTSAFADETVACPAFLDHDYLNCIPKTRLICATLPRASRCWW